ncbi:MAG: OsmC family protein [Vicinamibacteraceae bacterium]
MSDTDARPPMTVELAWDGELRFTARGAHTSLPFDSAGRMGPSPVEALVESLGACMGMDLVHFLERSRVPAEKMTVTVVAHRAADHPRRLVAVDLHADIRGAASDDVVTRGLQLSRDKYCSVWASLRPDIEFTTRFTVRRPSA